MISSPFWKISQTKKDIEMSLRGLSLQGAMLNGKMNTLEKKEFAFTSLLYL